MFCSIWEIKLILNDKKNQQFLHIHVLLKKLLMTEPDTYLHVTSYLSFSQCAVSTIGWDAFDS